VEVHVAEGDLMAVTETLATVVARIDPPAGFTPEQVRLAAQRAAEKPWPQSSQRHLEQRKYEILVWALARRNQILKDGVTHG
jgi:hypothetical protein